MDTPTFGFAVRERDSGWVVELPHQCSEWSITDAETSGYAWSLGIPHAQAVAEMEAFIAEAQEALAVLKCRCPAP
jgi:hypothetical protein